MAHYGQMGIKKWASGPSALVFIRGSFVLTTVGRLAKDCPMKPDNQLRSEERVYAAKMRSPLQNAKEQLAMATLQERWDYPVLGAHLESLAGMFFRTSKDQRSELIAQFHDCAGKLPYVADCDFGALVLESAADSVADDRELRGFLLSEARYRARWCVQAASAGGEAIARAVHMNRLEAKARNED